MTTLREAAQQALEALLLCDSKDAGKAMAAITFLRAALAWPEPWTPAKLGDALGWWVDYSALAQPTVDPTDPGHDVDVLREQVRHLERRVRELHALAQQEQEPVAKTHVVFEDRNGALRRTPADCQARGASGQPAAVHVGRQRYVPEQEQEPVAWANKDDFGKFDMRVRCNTDHYHTEPLWASPPRREWMGLSDTEVLSIHQSLCNTVGSDYRTVARAIEAALKEKNNG